MHTARPVFLFLIAAMTFALLAAASGRIHSFRRLGVRCRSFALRHHWYGLNLVIPAFMIAYTTPSW
jgi:hypothetical protein